MVQNYKRLFQIYIFWFLGSILLTFIHILPTNLLGPHSLFLIFTGVFAAVFFIMQYGKGLGWAITSLVFIISTCIEWMQISFSGDILYTSNFEFISKFAPFICGFIWVALIGGTHVIAREITLKINIDWLRGGLYAVIAASMVMIFEVLVDPILVQSATNQFLGNRFTVLQFSDVINWGTFGLILHLMIYFILSLTNRWEFLRYPALRTEIVVVYWIIIAFFTFLSLYENLWFSIGISFVANIIFTFCYYLSLDKEKNEPDHPLNQESNEPFKND